MLSEEIINHEFKRTFKGYDTEQVEEYIENLISMYEQLSNENKEIKARYEQMSDFFEKNREEAERLTEEKKQLLEDAKAEKEKILSDAAAEGESIVEQAREMSRSLREKANLKAQSAVEDAEGMARRLLSEAKSRADESDAECAQKKTAAEAEAKSIVDNALLEAKKLIRATKINCQKRTDEANAKIADIQAEHDRIARIAADFKCALFEAYSTQLLSLENIEIPEYQCPIEKTEENSEPSAEQLPQNQQPASESVTESVPEQETEEVSEPKPEPEPETEEQSYVFTDGVIDKSEGYTPPKKKEEKYKPSIYAGIEVQKEHSGQIRYDSTNIASVNKTIDGILEKKGKDPTQKVSDGTAKLGFLK